MYDGIIVGGGHAGIEACLAMARMNKKTLLITGNLQKVASLPCNPSIGGPAKGVVVREIDALGGQMAKSADKGQIQMKMLNTSKGPATWAYRAQIDKVEYPKIMLDVLKNTKNLDLKEALVDKLIIENSIVKGVVLSDGEYIFAKTVVITTGTYLNSQILVGHTKTPSGPQGEPTTKGVSNQLKQLGFEIIRLKTGTPPRIQRESIDYSKMSIQPSDNIPYTFSYDNKYYFSNLQENCYLTYTNQSTHEIILDNLNQSSMYGGIVEGVGPRYCPSIEDKIVRFSDKARHQIFIEPESLNSTEMYIQGLSTSMPKDIQERIVHSIVGLEKSKILKYAYAIEYDAINPVELFHSLETKTIKNLFCAGQINGTSGYEEAAAQGLMAGINASLKIDNKEAFVLGRDEAYIGVLVDDLVTKGTKEPYRLLTSRAEHRLLLRNDNADQRLTQYGYNLGLVDQETYNRFVEKVEKINELRTIVTTLKIKPNANNNEYLKSRNSSVIKDAITVEELVKRPEIGLDDFIHFTNLDFNRDVYEQVAIDINYSGYINKAYREYEKVKRLEGKLISTDLDYNKIRNLSLESREKLNKIKPRTLGQASRIIGVNPTDIQMILLYLETEQKKNDV